MRRAIIFMVAFSLVIPRNSVACTWDYDTLAMERQRFPEAQELIAGHFVRHSPSYYEWRIADRTAKPMADRTAMDFDDIAVSYDKLGFHEKAIETIQAKMVRWPDSYRYESEANLGTFHIHAGRLEEGVRHLKRAIEINPTAHFGREIYQVLLVEYVIESRKESESLPLDSRMSVGFIGFADFVLTSREPSHDRRLEEIQAAAKGIMGMMRFGQSESPILLEALGDLLFADGDFNDSKMLAARAYLRASYEVDDKAASDAYREKARRAIELQAKRDLPEIERDLGLEIAQGDAYFQQIAADEKAWVAAGKNLDIEFSNKYYEPPTLEINRPGWSPWSPEQIAAIIIGTGLATLIGLSGVALILAIRMTRRRLVASSK